VSEVQVDKLNIKLNDFVLTCDFMKNPQGLEIERLCLELAFKINLLNSNNIERFKAFNTLVAYVYPTANIEQATACAHWCNWLFFFDDIHDEGLEKCLESDRLTDRMNFHLNILRYGQTEHLTDPLSLLTLEFRDRVLQLANRQWLDRFCKSVENYFFQGVCIAAKNWSENTTPSVDDYLVQRDFDSAVETALDLIEIAQGIFLPDEIVKSEISQNMRLACIRSIALFNDIASYPKEVIIHNNPNNLVHVIQKERHCSIETATWEAIQLVNAFASEILELEALFLNQDIKMKPVLQTYLTGIKQWQAGNIAYSLNEARYRSNFSPFQELRHQGHHV
jgi:germacradienol/geosmin synthase